MVLVPRVLELLRANGQTNVSVFVGGIIPDEDAAQLLEMGVSGVYGPGSSTQTIAADIKRLVSSQLPPGEGQPEEANTPAIGPTTTKKEPIG